MILQAHFQRRRLASCQTAKNLFQHSCTEEKNIYIYIALIKKMPAAEKPGLYGNSTENTFTSCTL